MFRRNNQIIRAASVPPTPTFYEAPKKVEIVDEFQESFKSLENHLKNDKMCSSHYLLIMAAQNSTKTFKKLEAEVYMEIAYIYAYMTKCLPLKFDWKNLDEKHLDDEIREKYDKELVDEYLKETEKRLENEEKPKKEKISKLLEEAKGDEEIKKMCEQAIALISNLEYAEKIRNLRKITDNLKNEMDKTMSFRVENVSPMDEEDVNDENEINVIEKLNDKEEENKEVVD